MVTPSCTYGTVPVEIEFTARAAEGQHASDEEEDEDAIGLEECRIEPARNCMEEEVCVGAQGILRGVLPCLEPFPIQQVVCLRMDGLYEQLIN